jgi:hypothetical protein
LTTTTGRLVVRRTVRVSSSSSMASVCSDTWTRTARPAWTRPSETRWRQTVITPVVLTRRWTVTGLGPGPRRWTGGPGALEPERLLRRERVGAHAQQLARLRVEEHQRLRLDADDHGPSAEDLGRGHLAAGQGDDAALVDRAVDLDRRSILGRRQRRRPGRDRAPPGELGQIGGGQVRAQALDPGAGDRQVDHVDAGPEPHGLTGPGGAEPELPAHRPQVPRRRDHAIELDRPAIEGPGVAPASIARSAVGVLAGSGTEASEPGSHTGNSSRCSSETGWKRCAGVTGTLVSSA